MPHKQVLKTLNRVMPTNYWWPAKTEKKLLYNITDVSLSDELQQEKDMEKVFPKRFDEGSFDYTVTPLQEKPAKFCHVPYPVFWIPFGLLIWLSGPIIWTILILLILSL